MVNWDNPLSWLTIFIACMFIFLIAYSIIFFGTPLYLMKESIAIAVFCTGCAGCLYFATGA